jgi:hypothetical protein
MVRLQIALAFGILFVYRASAEQPKQAVGQVSERPSINELNLTLDAGKQHFCFWASAVYSPGSLVNFTDIAKNTTTCFHCNADGTWDKPCQ